MTDLASGEAQADGHDRAQNTVFSLGLYRTMVRIREFELEAERLFLANEIPGFIHVSIGQEAVAAGVCAGLEADDFMTTTHRGHGHTIAKGASMRGMMAELFGRASGVCGGMGGSMHIADFSIGMLGANGIVAGGIGLAVGAALQAKLASKPQVAVAFFSDGATARGPFSEALNLAQLWRLPVVFACENNGWASTTRSIESLSQPQVAVRAESMGVTSVVVDGNDVFEVADAATEALSRARQGGGPTLIEAATYRLRGHYVGDPVMYYDPAELQEWSLRDPITTCERSLSASGPGNRDLYSDIAVEARAEVADAVAYARNSPWPDPRSLASRVYADRTSSEI